MSGSSALDAVRAAYVAIETADRPEVWVSLRPQTDAEADAVAVDARVAAGEVLPLAGRTLAVKDNIDLAGLPTTAACPAFAYSPEADAPVVARLREAGAVVIGKTNLDQFATGLVGTRSPYGAVRDARRPELVSGGSSSGSGVAVALGLVDLALGTDTAGSGRVPAAFGGVVGAKPTRGLVPTVRVVPAVRELDCVSVFAASVGLATLALQVMAGVEDGDPTSRPWPADAPYAAPPAPRVGVPSASVPEALDDARRAAFDAAAARLAAVGAQLVPVDAEPVIAAGRLLYDGAFVAGRYAAYGEAATTLARTHPQDVDPTVLAIVQASQSWPAHRLVTDTETLDRLRLEVAALFAGIDALLLPTVAEQPSIAAVQADPIATNARLGRYTNGANLLDLSAIAVPAGQVDQDGGPVEFGVTLLAPAFGDALLADLAARFTGEVQPPAWTGGVELAVVGAHLSGLALNGQLTALGARLLRAVDTAAVYRLYDLGGSPARPGMVRVDDGTGAAIATEVWQLPQLAVSTLLQQVPAPLGFGRVQLADGTTPLGFVCEAAAVAGALDITGHGGWRAYQQAAGSPCSASTSAAGSTGPTTPTPSQPLLETGSLA